MTGDEKDGLRMVEAPPPKEEFVGEEVSDERKLAMFKQKVIILLDELKALYRPGALITFIVRYPNEPNMTSLITEEVSNKELGEWLIAQDDAKPIAGLTHAN